MSPESPNSSAFKVDELYAQLGFPHASLLEKRIFKRMVLEHGELTASDKRTLSDDVVALMNSQIDVWGAAVSGGYYAADAATITIYGGDFRVDGVLVAFGDLQVNSGQATGQLTGDATVVYD